MEKRPEDFFHGLLASADRGGPGLSERDARNPVEQVDPHRLHTNGQHRLRLTQRLQRYRGGLEPKGRERRLKAEKILRGVGEKDVDVFREPRKAVIRDRLAADDHVLNAMAFE